MKAIARGLICLMLGSGLAACSIAQEDKPGSEANDQRQSAQNADAVLPAEANITTVPTDSRTLTLNTQGVAPIGLTVRVKGIELGTDATMLTVSASYGGTETNNVPLASDPTYLQDEQGNKFMLKAPVENPRLNIVRGQQMDGKLVFLGAVAPGTRQLTLVFNDNNPGNSTIAPGLSIPLNLPTAAP